MPTICKVKLSYGYLLAFCGLSCRICDSLEHNIHASAITRTQHKLWNHTLSLHDFNQAWTKQIAESYMEIQRFNMEMTISSKYISSRYWVMILIFAGKSFQSTWIVDLITIYLFQYTQVLLLILFSQISCTLTFYLTILSNLKFYFSSVWI